MARATVSIRKATYDRLLDRARADQRSMSSVVEQLLHDYINGDIKLENRFEPRPFQRTITKVVRVLPPAAPPGPAEGVDDPSASGSKPTAANLEPRVGGPVLL
jgi:hypothetical protein